MIQDVIFYIFAAVLLVSAVMVISARNPVHSVLFLILGFFNAAGLFILLGAEFLAFILAIVYVGAVAVLFLFVVMMLDISFGDLRRGAMKIAPIGLLVGLMLLSQLVMLYMAWDAAPEMRAALELPIDESVTNTEALGAVLYTDYFLAFQISGMILLVAMIGAIVLTLRVRPDVRRQQVADQFARRPEDAMEVKKVTSGTGL